LAVGLFVVIATPLVVHFLTYSTPRGGKGLELFFAAAPWRALLAAHSGE
jgi:hypothetical protein